MTPPYRVGVIGAGLKGTQHARAYQLDPRTEVVAVAEKDPEVLELFRRRFGLERSYTDYREMLANEQIDIAAPILPSTVIPEVVLASVDAGVKGIFCEKPMCVTLEQADGMVEACESKGVHFASGDAERNYDALWNARAVIESGEIGDVLSFRTYGGLGEIWGGGCQFLSVMRMFAWDAEVDWLTGWVEIDPWQNNDQGMAGSIHFENGIDAYIYMRPGDVKGMEVLCEDGYLYYDWHQARIFKVWSIRRRRTHRVSGKQALWARPRRGRLDKHGDPAGQQHALVPRHDGGGYGAAMQRREHAQGLGDHRRHARVPPERLRQSRVPHRGPQPGSPAHAREGVRPEERRGKG